MIEPPFYLDASLFQKLAKCVHCAHRVDSSRADSAVGTRWRQLFSSRYSTRLARPPQGPRATTPGHARARVGRTSRPRRASDKGWSCRAAGRRRIHDSNMAAATSVVVLDRGNNTTCTINLHGVCMCMCVRYARVCPRARFGSTSVDLLREERGRDMNESCP